MLLCAYNIVIRLANVCSVSNLEHLEVYMYVNGLRGRIRMGWALFRPKNLDASANVCLYIQMLYR